MRNMSSQSKEEERKCLLEVIEQLRELPALWKIKSDEYSNRTKKELAYVKLLLKYREFVPNATREELKKKINTLRTNFRKELKKVNASQKSGAGEEDIYRPTAWFYEALLFLKDQETPSDSRNSISNDTCDAQDNQINEENPSEAATVSPPPAGHSQCPSSTPAWKRQRRNKEKENSREELLTLACEKLKAPDDENVHVARTWTHELTQMDPQQQLFAKKAINDILFEGRMGTLHRHSVQINVQTQYPQITRSSTPCSFTTQSSCSDVVYQEHQSEIGNFFANFQG